MVQIKNILWLLFLAQSSMLAYSGVERDFFFKQIPPTEAFLGHVYRAIQNHKVTEDDLLRLQAAVEEGRIVNPILKSDAMKNNELRKWWEGFEFYFFSDESPHEYDLELLKEGISNLIADMHKPDATWLDRWGLWPLIVFLGGALVVVGCMINKRLRLADEAMRQRVILPQQRLAAARFGVPPRVPMEVHIRPAGLGA